MTMNTVNILPQLPFAQPDVLDVAPELRRLAAEQPVARIRTSAGDLAWLVTRYDDVKALAADPRIGNSHDDPASAPRFSESALLGRPAVDAGTEQQFSNRVRKLLTPAFTPRRVRALQARVGDDVISDLVAAGPQWQLTNDDIALFAGMLLFAGHASTSIRIDFGTLLLLSNPGQVDALLRDPGLIPGAVEEIIRMTSPGDSGLTRYANADIDIGGVTIGKGDAVLLSTAMANRDERAFPDPDRFDVTRDPNPHLGFGHGRRFCIGASLARAELTAVAGQLFQRFPSLRLAAAIDDLWVHTDLLPGGLSHLPVTWS